MEDDQPMWEGPDDAAVAVMLSTGDEGRASDVVPRTLTAGLVAAGIRVLCLPCVGGPLDGRDERIRERLVARAAGAPKLVLAGISRGARVSAGLVGHLGAVGLVVFAYPFHSRTDPLPYGRERDLAGVDVPVLLVQGTRDSHGNRPQVVGYDLPENIRILWMEDANHALRPRPSSGSSQAEQLAEAVRCMVGFIRAL